MDCALVWVGCLGGFAIDSLVGGDLEIRGQKLHFPFYSFPFLSLGIGGGLARRIFRRWEILHFRNGTQYSLSSYKVHYWRSIGRKKTPVRKSLHPSPGPVKPLHDLGCDLY